MKGVGSRSRNGALRRGRFFAANDSRPLQEILQVPTGAAPHIDPGPARRRLDQVPQLLAAFHEPFAEVVIRLGLPRVKILHPRGMILAAHRFEGEVVEDLEVGSEAHETNDYAAKSAM